MSHTDEELLGEESEIRQLLDSEANYTSKYVGEGRYIEDGVDGISKSRIMNQVGKMFNFGALSSKKRGSATITKRGSSIRKTTSKKQQKHQIVAVSKLSLEKIQNTNQKERELALVCTNLIKLIYLIPRHNTYI